MDISYVAEHTSDGAYTLLLQAAASSINSAECLDPRNQNPEEWACDCQDHWLDECEDASSTTDIDSVSPPPPDFLSLIVGTFGKRRSICLMCSAFFAK